MPDPVPPRFLQRAALLLLLPWCFLLSHAEAAEYSVCASGCDFPTLTAAIQEPGLGTTEDTLTIDSTYTFVPLNEDSSVNVPDNVHIICEEGAGTIGDEGDATFSMYGGSNNLIQDCTFENAHWDYTGDTGVDFIGNTISPDVASTMIFTAAFDIIIRGNEGIQKIQIQTAHNMLIEENSFENRFENGALNVVTAGIPDYSDPDAVSGDVLIQNNTFTNYLVNNGGDWVTIVGGNNIQFMHNTMRSAVVMNDMYVTMISVSNAQAEFKYNYLITPEKVAPKTAATVPFNMRNTGYDTTALYEHNTIFRNNGGSPGADQNSCFTLFDDESYTNVPMNITARYNLCHQDGTSAQGQGFQFFYDVNSADVTLIDSFNGFSNIDDAISDTTDTLTSVNANTVTRKALLRLENVDTSDDLYPNPVSTYLDVDGTKDIGAFSAVRETTILIDDDCVVDYITCHSQNTTILPQALKNDDEVQIAAGTYSPFALHDLWNITITGAGDDTIIDGGGGTLGMHPHNVHDSFFSDMLIKNASVTTEDYLLTMDTLSTVSADYNTFGAVLFMEAGCTSTPITPNLLTHIYSLTGVGTEDLNIFLVHVVGPEYFLTILAPESIASNAAELAALCGVPEGNVDYVITPGFSVSEGEYTLNTSGLTDAGISSTSGGPLPILDHDVTAASGLSFFASDNNTLTNITSTENARGMEIHSTSANNRLVNSNITGNTVRDIYLNGINNNFLDDTIFNPSDVEYNDTGTLTVRYSARALVTHRHNLAPLEGVEVQLTDASATDAPLLLTSDTGYTPFSDPLPAMVLSQSNPTSITAGGKNPYTLVASMPGFYPSTVIANLDEPQKQLNVTLAPIPTTLPIPTYTGGGGGGGVSGPSSPPLSPTVVPPSTQSPTSDSLPSPTNAIEVATEQIMLLKDFPGYTDLPKTDPAYIAFAYAHKIGAIQGFEDDTVGPHMLLQRDHIAKMVATSIYKISPDIDYCHGEAPFPDVPLDHWSAQYVCFAKARGIVTGYFNQGDDAGKYRPERVVSRAELVAILTRALPKMHLMGDQGNYEDIFPGPWYNEYAAISYRLHLFPINLAFGADRPARRVEVARILYSLHLQGLIP